MAKDILLNGQMLLWGLYISIPQIPIYLLYIIYSISKMSFMVRTYPGHGEKRLTPKSSVASRFSE